MTVGVLNRPAAAVRKVKTRIVFEGFDELGWERR